MLYRTTPGTSWSWIRWDAPARVLPLGVAPLVFLWLTGTSPAILGLTASHPVRDLLLALPFSILGFAVAAAFSEHLSRRAGRWFVPDRADLAVQSGYYLLLNAPAEEWFFRGFLQGSLIRWWHAPFLGYLGATLIFGAYHFLGKWGWRSVMGAAVAGFALGLLYLWQPEPPSLLLPVIVHVAITCGFLSLGPYAIFQWRRSRGRIHPQVETPRAVS